MAILNSWFKSNFSQHTQFVSLTQTDCTNLMLNIYSSLSTVNVHGVPQGSIWGPHLFPLYICQGLNFVLYADDNNILVVDKKEGVLENKITFAGARIRIMFL
jgi:hypothetical protein